MHGTPGSGRLHLSRLLRRPLDSGVRNFVKSPQTIYILNTSDQCIWFSEVLLLYNLGFETSKLYYKLHN